MPTPAFQVSLVRRLGAARTHLRREEGLPLTIWRTSVQLRTVCILLYFVYAGIAIIALVNARSDRAGEVVFVIAAIMGAYVNGAISLAPFVGLQHSGDVVVKNPFTTVRFPSGAVKSIDSSGLSVLTVRLVNDRTIKCWAIQATNAMLAAGKTTRVDKVGDEIRAAMGDLTSRQADVRVTTSFTRPSAVFWIFLGLVIAGCVAVGL